MERKGRKYLHSRFFLRKSGLFHARACLKKAFCKMCVTICGRFCPDEGVVAGYDNRIRAKYTAKWGVQIAGMIFQTGSSAPGTLQRKKAPSPIKGTKHIPRYHPDSCIYRLSRRLTRSFTSLPTENFRNAAPVRNSETI